MELVDDILFPKIALPARRRNGAGKKATGSRKRPETAAAAIAAETLIQFSQPAEVSSNSAQLSSLPEYRQFLELCYAGPLLDLLSDDQQQKLYQDLQTRPLLPALLQMYPPLNLLGYFGYSKALETFHPQVQHLEESLFNLAREHTERAAFYAYSGYRLHASEVTVPDTPKRQILKIALEEAGIGFNLQGELEWPLGPLVCEKLRQTLIPVLPRTSNLLVEQAVSLTSRGAAPAERMDFFERIITQPGTWYIQTSEYFARHSTLALQSRLINSLVEDQFVCVNLSLPTNLGTLLRSLEGVTRVCFFFCNPVPPSFWPLAAESLGSSVRTMLFIFEPNGLATPLQDLLDSISTPRLELQLTNAIPEGYQPDFDWSDGLLSAAFLRQNYWQSQFLFHLEELPASYADLPPLSAINPRHYADVVNMFCAMIMRGCGAKFLTGTWTEALHVWEDCKTMLALIDSNMKNGWFPNQQVNLLGDPLGTELTMTEIGEGGANCVLQTSDGQQLGNNFSLDEIEQSYVAPLSTMVHRHHNILFYYSAVRPLDRNGLYQLVNSTYQNVLIVEPPEALRLLV